MNIHSPLRLCGDTRRLGVESVLRKNMTDTPGAVTEASPDTGGKRRQIRPKAERRQQLIDATIRCIAQHGLSAVTMQMVTREAGLSVGIANLHFESKDNLLRETLRFVAEEYHGGQIEIMEGEDIPDLGERLDALLDFQLGRGVTQRQKMGRRVRGPSTRRSCQR
jgi:AcrR family transcriptional regulator